LVAVLDDSQTLHVANLGDSGMMILRPKKKEGDDFDLEVIFRTKEQQHFFNCPFQLGFPEGDDPRKADSYSIMCQEEDIIVAATDGVLDNLFDKDIVEVVKAELKKIKDWDNEQPMLSGSSPIQRIAVEIASAALRYAYSERDSPFVVNAVKSGIPREQIGSGGKVDDITVVVGRVTKVPVNSLNSRM
jgi:protein phosphatase PTC7